MKAIFWMGEARVRFLHCADLHLGKNHSRAPQRYQDFFDAFGRLVDIAIEKAVDAVLVAGDVFDVRNISARTHILARSLFDRLGTAGIDLIVIEGNHDRPARLDGFSWLDSFNGDGSLVLLRPVDGVRTPWDGEVGSSVEIASGIWVHGLGYLGGRTLEGVARMVDGLGEVEGFHILMVHCGVSSGSGFLGSGIFAADEFMPLVLDQVDYLALGHLHHGDAFSIAHTPGGTEFANFGEADSRKGAWLVEVNEDRTGFSAEFISSDPRPMFDLIVDCDNCENPEQVLTAVALELSQARAGSTRGEHRAPMIRLRLRGEVAFAFHEVLEESIREQIQVQFDPLYLEVFNELNLPMVESGESELVARDTIEEIVLKELVGELGRAENPDALYRLALELRTDSSVDQVVEALLQFGRGGWPQKAEEKGPDPDRSDDGTESSERPAHGPPQADPEAPRQQEHVSANRPPTTGTLDVWL